MRESRRHGLASKLASISILRFESKLISHFELRRIQILLFLPINYLAAVAPLGNDLGRSPKMRR